MAVTEAEFRTAVLPFTLHHEGGFSPDRADPGNWTGGKVGKGRFRGTKYGISAKAYPTLDIPNLTLAKACDIYWADYCVGPGFDKLDLPLLQVVFDAGVNCGPARARAWLALAADKPTTIEQIKAVSASNLAFHRSLKTWRRYGASWGARITACQAHALALLAAAPVAIVPRVAPPVAATPRAHPQASAQPIASPLVLFIRALLGALTQPTPQGALS
jgi:lysozyme family protein